jgi:HK97 gp10 family phage protein
MRLQVTGLDEMQGKVKLVQQAMREDVVRQAARAGAGVILGAMQARAPERVDMPTAESTSLPPGAIKASLRISIAKMRAGLVTAKIGPTKKIKGLVAAVEYGHRLIKGGWSRVTAKRVAGPGKVIGHVPAHPFLRPAFDESASDAIAASAAVVRERLGKALS